MELKPAKDLRVLTKAFCENYAREIFDPHDIARKIENASSMGQDEVRVFQKLPLDLAGAEAFEVLEQRLRSVGYSLHWLRAAQKEYDGKRETGNFIKYNELLISWRKEESIIKYMKERLELEERRSLEAC